MMSTAAASRNKHNRKQHKQFKSLLQEYQRLQQVQQKHQHALLQYEQELTKRLQTYEQERDDVQMELEQQRKQIIQGAKNAVKAYDCYYKQLQLKEQQINALQKKLLQVTEEWIKVKNTCINCNNNVCVLEEQCAQCVQN